MRRIVFVLALLVIGLAVWRFRAPLADAVADIRGERDGAAETSPELAAGADRKLEALASGEAAVVALSGPELQSLLEYRYPQVLPAFVDSPRVEIRRGRLRVRGRVPVEHLPRVGGIGDAAAFLPDTAELAVTGQFMPLDDGRVALGIDEVSTGMIPLPRRLLPGLLRQLGRQDEPGLPNDALALPLPGGAGTAFLRGDSLYLRAHAGTRN
jgi:hypothetical protein